MEAFLTRERGYRKSVDERPSGWASPSGVVKVVNPMLAHELAQRFGGSDIRKTGKVAGSNPASSVCVEQAQNVDESVAVQPLHEASREV